MVFYLKVNRRVEYTIRNLQHWVNTVMLFPGSMYYILCDNEELKDDILKQINFKGSIPQFLKSSEDEGYDKLISCITLKKWHRAGCAHLTTFIHAKEHGFNRFWNIDADDTLFCLDCERLKELLLCAQIYADNHRIDLFSLDMWRSRAHGGHWSFGVTYTNGQISWMNLMNLHSCHMESSKLFVNGDRPKNIDEFFSFLKEKEKTVKIETFYVENLLFIHYSEDFIVNPITSSVCIWKDGKVLFPILYNIYGTKSLGLIPIADDVRSLDIGITDYEGQLFLAKASKFSVETENVLNAEEFADSFDEWSYEQMKSEIIFLDENKILKNKDIFVFGYGKYTQLFICMLEEKGYTIEKILDNNINKQGKLCSGIEIVSPNYVKDRLEERTEIIIAVKYYEAIYMQLKTIGFKKEPIKLFDYGRLLE